MAKLPLSSSPIFSHVTLGVSDLGASMRFYDATLGVLGLVRHSTAASFAGYGHEEDGRLGANSIWILRPRDGHAASAGNGTNIALLAASREAVRHFHRTALSSGGRDDGAPGIRAEAHPDFYAAYVLDPDGHKIVAVCHADPAEPGQ